MNKICKNCQSTFIPSNPGLEKSKVFCSLSCSQEWWKIKRNKTGKFIGDSKKFGILARKTLHLNGKQQQLIMGSLLGDGCIGEKINKLSNSYFYSEGHTVKQKDYLIHKMTELKGFVAQSVPTPIKPNGFSIFPKVSFTSVVHSDFYNLFNLFYKKENNKRKKIILRSTLDKIEPLGLLYWYLDDGDISKKKTIKLSTYSFTEEEHLLLQQWLIEKFGINSIITPVKKKKMFYLRFNVADSKKFLSLILPFKNFVPTNMHYKIPAFLNQPTTSSALVGGLCSLKEFHPLVSTPS